ncbi:hypothetical protein DEU36_2874 [Microbacterium sp. AG238]|nr:hypothetical protein DEU36_2874 [Microbacterium sp. AG238]
MTARHNFPTTAKEHAENAVGYADDAARSMNEATSAGDRDRAFESLSFAVLELSRAVAKIAAARNL